MGELRLFSLKHRKKKKKGMSTASEIGGAPVSALTHACTRKSQERRGRGAERLSGEAIAKNLPNLKRDMSLCAQEVQQTPRRVNSLRVNAWASRYVQKKHLTKFSINA